MQEQVSILVFYHFCRDIIGKCVTPILIGVKPATIVDGVTMHQFVGLFHVEATLQTLTFHVEETFETWEPLVSLVNDALQVAYLLLVLFNGAVEFPCVVVLQLLHIGVESFNLSVQLVHLLV